MSLPDKRARGGIVSSAYTLRDSLAEEGLDVRGFLYGGRTDDETLAYKAVARLFDLFVFGARIAVTRPDVVHLNSSFDFRGVLRDSFFALLARATGCKVLIKFHGADLSLLESDSWFSRFVVRAVMRSAHLVCVLNSAEQTALAAHSPNARVVMVKNPLDLDSYTPTRNFRAEYDIPQNKPLLLFIARFVPEKGLSDVIEALPMVRERHDAHAVFIGDGPLRGEAEELCRRLELTSCTTFTGYLAEEAAVDGYRAATMLVFPTALPEGQPMVVFHAFASGLPVISTRFRAANDWLEDGKDCLFVPPHDPKAVAAAVIQLLDHAERREALAKGGHQIARQFERHVVAREFAALYASLQE
jgi:glycosyltransferase involved in cell wall biosynthesis